MGYVASKLEKAFEKSVVEYLKEKGIKLHKMNKFGHDEDAPEYELKYDIYVECSEDECAEFEKEFDLAYVGTEGSIHTLTYSFDWCIEAADFEKFCDDANEFIRAVEEKFGISVEGEDVFDHFFNGIQWGELE